MCPSIQHLKQRIETKRLGSVQPARRVLRHLKQRIETLGNWEAVLDEADYGISNRELKPDAYVRGPTVFFACISNRELKLLNAMAAYGFLQLERGISNRELKLTIFSSTTIRLVSTCISNRELKLRGRHPYMPLHICRLASQTEN